MSGSMTNPNANMFDPAAEGMWSLGSDVDWIRGDYVNGLEHPGQFARRHPWLVANRLFAESMVKSNPRTVAAIVGALMSWRVCTIGQLHAGLSTLPVPDFQRDEPNLYGALCRLGVINIGFDPRERLEDITLPYTWISMGNKATLIRDALSGIESGQWFRKALASSRLNAMRVHARHNTFASHVGLALASDPRTRLVGGDGWGGFRFIDAQAVAESGMNRMSSTDVVALCGNNVLAGIEVQVTSNDIEKKIRNWATLLAYSPMSRRGLLCVWLLVRDTAYGQYPSTANVIRRSRELSEMMVGEPSVAARMGFTTWEEWFDHGRPTDGFGSYEDMLGVRRSMFDDEWRRHTPHVGRLDAIDEWGWRVMRDSLAREWGVDARGWTMPDAYRGGFYGFAKGGSEHGIDA